MIVMGPMWVKKKMGGVEYMMDDTDVVFSKIIYKKIKTKDE